ncbi:DUF1654 domain-containing protein [Pseudomonas sp. SDO5591_S426]
MPKIASPAVYARDSYELVGRRIQRLIAAPGVQKVQIITVARNDDESPEAWCQVIQEIEDTSGIRIERLDSDTVRIGWREYYEA